MLLKYRTIEKYYCILRREDNLNVEANSSINSKFQNWNYLFSIGYSHH